MSHDGFYISFTRPLYLIKPCLLSAWLALTGCGSQTTPTQSSCQQLPSNPQALVDTKRIYHYIQQLSCDEIPGVLSGQNAGHGDQIIDPMSPMGYQQLLAPMGRTIGRIPAVLGIDYEHDNIFTLEQLLSANTVLIAHAKRGGLVTINWSPISPWYSLANQGRAINWQGTRVKAHEDAHLSIQLGDLLNPQKPAHATWLQKLDIIASALQDLQRAGVTVLWRPLQEMNGDWFWWGHTQPVADPTDYIALWQHMHDYFSREKQLNNLLWVYSPNKTLWINLWTRRSALWAYPGDAFVDIVAGTLYDDSLRIPDYIALSQLHKPLAIAEYGPSIGARGDFDNTRYATRLLKNYPEIAYWVSWHNYPVGDNEWEKQALTSNKNLQELFRNPLIITLPAAQDD